jgi:hypothetical protein
MDIPTGWHIVREGLTEIGDKYWTSSASPKLDSLWLPVISGEAGEPVEKYRAVIRKGN